MNRSHLLTKKSSSEMLAWGLTFTVVGGVICAVAFPFTVDSSDSGGAAALSVLGALIALVGWIMLAMALVRLAAKADDLHRIYVEKNVAAPQRIESVTPAADIPDWP